MGPEHIRKNKENGKEMGKGETNREDVNKKLGILNGRP